MKHFSINIWVTLFLAVILLVIVSACKKNNDYHVSGNVILATTGEPIEGVLVEVYHQACDIGVPCWHQEAYFATTNSNGKYEMIFKSKETQMEKIFSKEFLYIFNSGNNRFIIPGSSSLNNISLFTETEAFELIFESTLPNIKEVLVELEWDRFKGTVTETAQIDSSLPNFGIANYFGTQSKFIPLYIGEQWLKLDFDILFEDETRLLRTDSIWLPGRYYDLNDYAFDDPRRHPVYKFSY